MKEKLLLNLAELNRALIFHKNEFKKNEINFLNLKKEKIKKMIIK